MHDVNLKPLSHASAVCARIDVRAQHIEEAEMDGGCGAGGGGGGEVWGTGSRSGKVEGRKEEGRRTSH
eukprot:474153-Rhodomonas_salina.3